MQKQFSDSSTTSTTKFRRHDGPIGGVAAGLGRTFGLEAGLLRLATIVAAILMGPVVIAGYVGLWYLMPVDESVPEEHRPGSPPLALVVILAVIFGLGIAFDIVFGVASMISAIPSWIILGALAYVLIRRARRAS